MKLIQHIYFLHKAYIKAFLCLGSLDVPVTLYLGTKLSSKITKESTKYEKTWH